MNRDSMAQSVMRVIWDTLRPIAQDHFRVDCHELDETVPTVVVTLSPDPAAFDKARLQFWIIDEPDIIDAVIGRAGRLELPVRKAGWRPTGRDSLAAEVSFLARCAALGRYSECICTDGGQVARVLGWIRSDGEEIALEAVTRAESVEVTNAMIEYRPYLSL